ncbi:MAG: hypothetical protein WDA27_11130 [Actinomycetota bacterium]
MTNNELPLRLVVLGDSTAFTTDRGPQLPFDPELYPNVIAEVLERGLGRPVQTTVIARPGADTRDAWRMVTKDRHIQFEVLMGADAVVVACANFDNAPAGVPPVLEAIVPYLRTPWLRRRARVLLQSTHPWGVAISGGRFSRTPLNEFLRMFDGLLFQVRALARNAAGVVMGPIGHNSAYYGFTHPKRAEREQLQFAIAKRHGFPTVASWPFIEPAADRLNPDGIHWPADVHRAVGEALAAPLLAQLKGEAERPKAPQVGDPLPGT